MTDQITITIELPREVANDVGYGWGDNIGKELLAVRDACRKALANPQPETPGLPEAAQNFIAAAKKAGIELQQYYDRSHDEGFSDALSQIPEAKSHDYPLFDLGRALATIERLKSAHHPNSRAVADLDNLAFCLKLAACGEVDSPPPTAPGEASEELPSSEVARVAETAAAKIAAADDYWRNKLAATEQPFLALMDSLEDVTVDVLATGHKALDSFLEAESKAWKFLYGNRPNPRSATREQDAEGNATHDAGAKPDKPNHPQTPTPKVEDSVVEVGE